MAKHQSGPASGRGPKVGLFVTCLVDLFRPNIGFAAVDLLRAAGCRVEVPEVQTCCGQPAYNSGDHTNGAHLARQVVEAFEPYDYLVAPSGSCAAMIKHHYPDLFPTDAAIQAKAEALGERTFELLGFLRDVMKMRLRGVRLPACATYHDSCSGLREMGIRAQPRSLLSAVEGLQLVEMGECDACCGFGGTFCVKYPQISERLVSDKAKHITATGAELVLGGDLGCLMNIAGRLRRLGSPLRVYHTAEVLARRADGPGVGGP